jgi:hypothetical protein
MRRETLFSSVSGRKGFCVLLMCSFLFFLSLSSYADNPIFRDVYTADPSAYIGHDGRMYVVCTHDHPDASDYSMLWDYYVFSSSDMVNWQNHGVVFDARSDSSWASLAYAPSMAYRNGTYYLYFPDGANAIGVATSSSPTGRFSDAIGRALVDRNTPNSNVEWCFDPCIFVDDDGQAYLYFGGGGPGNARVIRVNSDMSSVNGSAVTIDAPRFFEAAFMHKRNGIYYFSYSSDFSEGSATIEYMTSSDPMTGFQHRGTILGNPWDNLGNNNHHSIIEYQGQWYIFYHNRALSNSTYQRSVCVDYLYYNSDGTIQRVNDSQQGVDPVTSTSEPTTGPTPTPTTGPTTPPSQDPIFSGGPYSLNGTSDYVDLPDGLTNDLYDFSVACWVKLNSLDTWSRIFDLGGDTTVFMMLTPASGNTGYPYFCITTSGNDGEQGIDGTSAMPTGSWQHLAVVLSGSTGILYINTQEAGRNNGITLKPADLGNTVNNYIGRSQWSQDPYLNAEIDEFVVYNRALSASEVTNLGSTPPGGSGTLGDANGSGAIDIVDALIIAQYYVGLNPSGFIAGNADTNCDGSINIVDALLVAQYYVGLISGFC